MPEQAFYTRSPMLADLKRLVQENAHGEYRFHEFRHLFNAVEIYCAEYFPSESRGGWFSPRVVGGAQVSHVPPHVLYAVFAIYMHLAYGDLDPVPFLNGPLEMNGATAVMLEPTDRFMVLDRTGCAHPMTDFIIIAPTSTPLSWTLDTYGLPELQVGIAVIGWHAAAQPHWTALNTSQLLMHVQSKKVLDPLATFTEEEEGLFFSEPVNHERLGRHRDRLVETFATPLDVMQQNSGTALRVLKEYLAL
jgi:hypothetical protein